MAKPEKVGSPRIGGQGIAPVDIHWRERLKPLEPVAVAGRGPVAGRLGRRLGLFPEKALSAFRGVAGKDVLLVMGPPDQLPWVDGAEYLGKDPDEPGLLLPTNSGPVLQAGMMKRALECHFKVVPPLAVLAPNDFGWMVIPLISALPVAPHILATWLEDWR